MAKIKKQEAESKKLLAGQNKGKVVKFKGSPKKKEKFSVKKVKQQKDNSQSKSAQNIDTSAKSLQLSNPPCLPPLLRGTDKVYFSPRIYRFITERWFLLLIIALVLLGSIILVTPELNKSLQQKKQAQVKRAQIQKEISYWQGITNKYKGYRDGYLELAILEYQLGNAQASQHYLNEVLFLDPNFKDADTLKRMIASGN